MTTEKLSLFSGHSIFSYYLTLVFFAFQVPNLPEDIPGPGLSALAHKSHEEVKPWECKICGKAFQREHHLTAHEKKNECVGKIEVEKKKVIVESNSEKPFACSVCGKAFSEEATKKYHEEKFHPKKKEKIVFQVVKGN